MNCARALCFLPFYGPNRGRMVEENCVPVLTRLYLLEPLAAHEMCSITLRCLGWAENNNPPRMLRDGAVPLQQHRHGAGRDGGCCAQTSPSHRGCCGWRQ